VSTDISVSGFKANQPIYLEICDGVAPTTAGWEPTLHCDTGSSPAAGVANGSGSYTFSHTDPNHALKPFKGASPSGSFNCVAAHDNAPNNGFPTFRNCQLRASSNNAAVTSDQSFVTMILPDAAGSAPDFPYAIVLPLAALLIGGGFVLIQKRRTARAPA
jgi:hypothetical protein